MNNSIKVTALLALSGLLLWRCGNSGNESVSAGSAQSANGLPQDVYASCTLDQATFNSWFAGGKASENGFVTAANSVTFPHRNNCDFYQWSERMFLWVTSPAKDAYNQPGTILESPLFFSVSPVDSTNQRTLIPHMPGTMLRMGASLQKNGPHRLPVIRGKRGRLFEVETPVPVRGALAMVKSEAGGAVAVDHVQDDGKGGVVFVDKANRPILHPKALIQHRSGSKNIVHRFALGNKFVFLDASGNIIESEEGQATGDALMTRNGAMVYYLSFVNDVYAYYLTGAKAGQLNGNQFPTTAGARDSICAVARAHSVTLPDSNALAIEIKSSWVEASTLSDPENYITVNASIPVYDTSNPKQWIAKSERTAKMALVGMHIVGSVAGHPEMVWATFEQKNNTPNAAYAYLDKNKNVKTVPQDQGKRWLFNSNTADTTYNVSHMKSAGDTINAKPGHVISASNTLMVLPWGSAADSVTNLEDGSSAASNSEVISINNSVLGMLLGNDIRKNYFFIGATWTSGGAAPNGNSYGSDTTPGVAIGTSVLANSTMETYFQTAATSCFTCHSGTTVQPTDLSHIYDKLQPLFDSYNRNKKPQAK